MELVSEPNFVPVSEGRVPHSVTPKDCLEGDNIAYKIQYCGIILIRGGPMFMDFQKFPCLWGHDFMGNCLVALQCKTIHYFVNIHGDVNSNERVTHKI